MHKKDRLITIRFSLADIEAIDKACWDLRPQPTRPNYIRCAVRERVQRERAAREVTQ